jgi:ferredoxin-NADP reductase
VSHLHGAVLASAHDETPTLRTLVLEAPADVAASYAVPGQFVRVRLPGFAAAPFALATAPGEPLQLLVKRSAGLADALAALPAGSALEVSHAHGKGFPLADAAGQDVLLFATGSGIAPIRAVLRSLLRERDRYGAVHLFFGVRTADELPYREELDRAAASGVTVHRVISQGHDGGYVQERFQRELPPVQRAVAYLCGVPGMIHGSTDALRSAGMPAERIHLNH